MSGADVMIVIGVLLVVDQAGPLTGEAVECEGLVLSPSPRCCGVLGGGG